MCLLFFLSQALPWCAVRSTVEDFDVLVGEEFANWATGKHA